MEVLVPGRDPVAVDLVFVHGLRGHHITTWTTAEVLWPRDFLPADAPHARVLTFGYDADVVNFFSVASHSSIFQHAQNLLQDLQRERRSPDEKQRPLIFIGHSLGGLVIKDALCKAFEFANQRRQPRVAALYHATSGVIFLGTPHRGGNKTAWANIAINFAKAVLQDPNQRVVDALTRGSEVLERMQDSFSGLLQGLTVYSFFEDLPVKGFGKVVDDDSATIGHPNEIKQWLPADHMGMCKFDDRAMIAYKRVSSAIIESIEDSLDRVQSGQRVTPVSGLSSPPTEQSLAIGLLPPPSSSCQHAPRSSSSSYGRPSSPSRGQLSYGRSSSPSPRLLSYGRPSSPSLEFLENFSSSLEMGRGGRNDADAVKMRFFQALHEQSTPNSDGGMTYFSTTAGSHAGASYLGTQSNTPVFGSSVPLPPSHLHASAGHHAPAWNVAGGSSPPLSYEQTWAASHAPAPRTPQPPMSPPPPPPPPPRPLLTQSPQPQQQTDERRGLFERCGNHARADEIADLKDLHHWTRALELEVQVLKQQRHEHGDQHPATMQSAYSIAQIYLGYKRFDDADVYVAWSRREAPVAFRDHPSLARRADSLAAAIMFERGRVREAEELAFNVYTGQSAALGGEHLDTLVTRRTLALASWVLGNGGTSDAREHIVSCYHALQRRAGAEHPLTLQAALDVAECVLDVHRVPENDGTLLLSGFLEYVPKPPPPDVPRAPPLPALPAVTAMIEFAGARLTARYRPHILPSGNEAKHPLVLRAQVLQGRAAFARGDASGAEKLRRTVLQARESLGERHMDAQWSSIALGELYARLGRGNDALRHLLPALPIVDETYGAGSLAGARVELLCGQACMAPMLANSYTQTDYARAQPHFTRAWEAFERELGAEHAYTQAARKGLDACKMALH